MGEGKEDLGVLLKSLLQEHSLSMRKLGKLTGIDTATISRIINGKQLAKPQHLQEFAAHFGVPLKRLFEAAGYKLGRQIEELPSDIHISVDTIQEVLSSSGIFDWQYTSELVEQSLTKYAKYAQTEEGQQIIIEGFQEKVRQIGGVGPFIDDLRQMFEQYSQDSTSTTERAIIGSGLLYFILSTDVIPDYAFPIGYLDDAIAVKLVLNRLARLKDDAKEKERKRHRSLERTVKD